MFYPRATCSIRKERDVLFFGTMLLALVTVPVAFAKKPWIDLLEGGNLDQWTQTANTPGEWVLEDGVVSRPAGKKCGSLTTKETFIDFELVFEWKISKDGNSGVFYRSAEGWSPEYQVLDDAKQVGKRDWNRSRAAGMFDLFGRSTDDSTKPVGEWNSAKIVAKGKRLQHWLNGVKVVDVEVGSPEWIKEFERSKFENLDTFGKIKGTIWLQDHGAPVWYRNIKIREL
ncbi:3-keto-disaccharide hydrolase [Pelagicoccus mobilis]|uniref:DUF1080 domain-containing protein n=1 Tax=Pelagicoccus mobilis TaxID=415221 RepID=A0A934RY99_9BACT|nr:DUF1080 domain-containing protein [Pelagicoccus mobilis]MBK1877695.1 DUF1080 domain-containing protein [Pelagicoccus mobilis]